MFLDALEAFLCHVIQTGDRVEREESGYDSMYIPDSRSRTPSEFVDLVSDGRLQTEMFEKRGMQLVGKGLGIVRESSGSLAKMLKMISQRWVREERSFERTDIDGEDGKPLCKIIV